jgi:hypothetical protein
MVCALSGCLSRFNVRRLAKAASLMRHRSAHSCFCRHPLFGRPTSLAVINPISASSIQRSRGISNPTPNHVYAVRMTVMYQLGWCKLIRNFSATFVLFHKVFAAYAECEIFSATT